MGVGWGSGQLLNAIGTLRCFLGGAFVPAFVQPKKYTPHGCGGAVTNHC